MNSLKLEHLTNQSDEAIQNLASLYNKDELTIGKLNVTGEATANSFGDIKTNKVKTNKLQLGDKFLLSGDGDAQANDTWLRLLNGNGSADYYGGVAANEFWTASGKINGRNLFAELDALKTHVQNSRINCNWNGWRTFCGNCSDKKDDFNLHCDGGKLTHFNVQNTGAFYRP